MGALAAPGRQHRLHRSAAAAARNSGRQKAQHSCGRGPWRWRAAHATAVCEWTSWDHQLMPCV